MSGPARGDGWQSFFWTLFKRSRNAVALIDENRRHVEVNGAFVRLVGRKRAELADELHIAHNTVRTHVRNAMTKVNARSRSHLVAVSMADGHLAPGNGK